MLYYSEVRSRLENSSPWWTPSNITVSLGFVGAVKDGAGTNPADGVGCPHIVMIEQPIMRHPNYDSKFAVMRFDTQRDGCYQLPLPAFRNPARSSGTSRPVVEGPSNNSIPLLQQACLPQSHPADENSLGAHDQKRHISCISGAHLHYDPATGDKQGQTCAPSSRRNAEGGVPLDARLLGWCSRLVSPSAGQVAALDNLPLMP